MILKKVKNLKMTVKWIMMKNLSHLQRNKFIKLRKTKKKRARATRNRNKKKLINLIKKH